MTKPIDKTPRNLLDRVKEIIRQDIQEIEALSEQGKLSSEVSGCVVRYSEALLKMIKDQDSLEASAKESAQKMSTEELIARAQEGLKKLAPKV